MSSKVITIVVDLSEYWIIIHSGFNTPVTRLTSVVGMNYLLTLSVSSSSG
jgi:hypothetical protein